MHRGVEEVSSEEQGPPLTVKLAKCCLALAWLLPCLGILWSSLSLGHFGFSASVGVGASDSGRLLLLALCLLAYAFSSALKTSPLGLVSILSLMFLAWTAVASLMGGAFFDSLLFAQVWWAAALFFSVARRFKEEMKKLPTRAYLLHGPVILILLHALTPLLFESDSPRIGGVFEMAGVLANWLVLLLPLLLYDALREKGLYAWLGICSSSLSLAAIAFTFSRAGWLFASLELSLVLIALANLSKKDFLVLTLSLFLGLTGLVFFRSSFSPMMWGLAYLALLILPLAWQVYGRKLHPKLLGKLLAVLLLSGLWVLGISTLKPAPTSEQRVGERLESLTGTDNSSTARIVLWQSALAMTGAHLSHGVGPGDFSTHYPQYQTRYYYYSDSPHSAVLELSSELGLPGVLLFGAVFLTFLKKVLSFELSPFQRAALVGLLSAMAYAQIDVSYQFAYLWLSLSLVGVLLLPPAESPSPPAKSNRPLQVLASLFVLAALVYLLPPILNLEMARAEAQEERALHLSREASSRLPWWRKATITAFQKQLRLQPDDPWLREHMPRLLRQGDDSAIAYALAGDFLKNSRQMREALSQYQRAVALDPYNHPDFYRSIYEIAALFSDRELREKIQERVLSIYNIEDLRLAHFAHRANIKAQLNPLLYQICDNLNPYYKPEQTEPIYRYLYEEDQSPQAAHGLGVSLWTLGRLEEAHAYLAKAHQLDPIFPAPPSLSR